MDFSIFSIKFWNLCKTVGFTFTLQRIRLSHPFWNPSCIDQHESIWNQKGIRLHNRNIFIPIQAKYSKYEHSVQKNKTFGMPQKFFCLPSWAFTTFNLYIVQALLIAPPWPVMRPCSKTIFFQSFLFRNSSKKNTLLSLTQADEVSAENVTIAIFGFKKTVVTWQCNSRRQRVFLYKKFWTSSA